MPEFWGHVRYRGPRGEKGLLARNGWRNGLVFGQRETVDGVWVPVCEPRPGPRRRNNYGSLGMCGLLEKEAGFILAEA